MAGLDPYDYLMKVIVIGDAGVGKTCMISKFSDRIFQDKYAATLGVDFKIKTVNVLNKVVKLQLWDTAGQERFKCLTRGYYAKCDGVVVVYDVTNLQSFENLSYWLNELDVNNTPSSAKRIIVGNKTDHFPRRVDYEKAKRFSDHIRIPYIETSSYSGLNLHALFSTLAEQFVRDKPVTQKPDSGAIRIGNSTSLGQTGDWTGGYLQGYSCSSC